MGSSGSKKKNTELTIAKENIQINKKIKINEPIKMTETKSKNNRIKECILQTSSPFEKIDRHLSNVSKSICKIKIQTEIGIIKGTGFLLILILIKNCFIV